MHWPNNVKSNPAPEVVSTVRRSIKTLTENSESVNASGESRRRGESS